MSQAGWQGAGISEVLHRAWRWMDMVGRAECDINSGQCHHSGGVATAVIVNLQVEPKRQIVYNFCRSKAETLKGKRGEIKRQASERSEVSCLQLHLPSSLLTDPTKTLPETEDSGA